MNIQSDTSIAMIVDGCQTACGDDCCFLQIDRSCFTFSI